MTIFDIYALFINPKTSMMGSKKTHIFMCNLIRFDLCQ